MFLDVAATPPMDTAFAAPRGQVGKKFERGQLPPRLLAEVDRFNDLGQKLGKTPNSNAAPRTVGRRMLQTLPASAETRPSDGRCVRPRQNLPTGVRSGLRIATENIATGATVIRPNRARNEPAIPFPTRHVRAPKALNSLL